MRREWGRRDDDLLANMLIVTGMTFAQIAKALHRPRNSIASRVRKLGLTGRGLRKGKRPAAQRQEFTQ